METLEEKVGFGGKARRLLTNHLIDATTINLTANMLYGVFERYALQQPLEQVLKARTEGTIATYAYAGIMWGWVRDKIHNKLEGRPMLQTAAVSAWSFAFNVGILEIIYRNSAHHHRDALVTAVPAIAFGVIIGHAKDVGRNYLGYEKKELPAALEISEPAKRLSYAVYAAASIGVTTALCYWK